MKCVVICTALLAVVLPAWAWGAESPLGDTTGRGAAPLDPLDQELLRDLQRRSGDAKPEPADQPSVPRQSRDLQQPEQPGEGQEPEEEPMGLGEQAPDLPAQQDDIDVLQQRLRRELRQAAVPEEQEPLLEIARQMRVVEKRIEQYDSGSITQGMQQQILADLERLITSARRACKQGVPAAGGSQPVAGRTPVTQPSGQQPAGQQPGQSPGRTSAARQGETEPGLSGPDAAQLRELVKNLWGELPPRAREQMLESFDEAFVPKYRLLIEQYFRRLAKGHEEDGFGL